MATTEFITKRIDGKRKEIDKLTKKLERIEKAKESNWEINPYYYSESDLKHTERNLETAKTALAKYEKDLEDAKNKAASRNIPVITEFLDKWEVRTVEWFLAEREKYALARKEYADKDKELTHRYNYEVPFGSPERKKAREQMRRLTNDFREKWSHILQFEHGSDTWENTMKKDVAKEKDRKYDDLLERVIAITGEITNADNLFIGKKGDINGFIEGAKGRASINTIGAGGYNIQCYHFRTLVHRYDKED